MKNKKVRKLKTKLKLKAKKDKKKAVNNFRPELMWNRDYTWFFFGRKHILNIHQTKQETEVKKKWSSNWSVI